MIPKFRAWHNELGRMMLVKTMFFFANELEELELNDSIMNDNIPVYPDEIKLMQSTGLHDKNGKEIFEGDILKFNDEWDDYCYEGYVDGSIEGINFVEIERETTCFTFGKFQTSDSSLLYLMRDEYLSFEDLITDKDFEFEIVGNIYENPELLEVK